MSAQDPTPVAVSDGTGWSQHTRDTWFYGFLTVSAIGVAVLFWPFAYVLLFASTTVVVTWPIFERVLRRCKGRRGLAAAITTLMLGLLVFVPLSVLIGFFVTEAVVVIDQIGDWLGRGELDRLVRQTRDEYVPAMLSVFSDWLPEDFDLVAAIVGPAQTGVLGGLNAIGASLPALVNSVVGFSIDAVIYVFAVITLYMEGPRVLTVAKNLSPMEDAYEEHLFRVFREFANNMVLGSLVTAAIQGLVAAAGYAIVGVERVVFLGILTGVMSFVPLVGTLVVWLPVVIYVATTEGPGWAVALAVWNLLITGSVDNVVKPLFLRGSTQIHPLLIFLAVFGGLYWMSIPGVLIGPVIVAFFLALYTIYCQDRLGKGRGLPEPGPPSLLERVLAVVDPRQATLVPSSELDASDAPAAAPAPPPPLPPPTRTPPPPPTLGAVPEALPQADDDGQIGPEPEGRLPSEPGAPPRSMAQGSQSDDLA